MTCDHVFKLTVTEMLTDAKQYCKALVLRLKARRTTEECHVELNRIGNDIKMDATTNIDAIIECVIQMRPALGSPNYEQTSRLYDSILDQTQKIMEDLDKTFAGIFEEFNRNMERLWQAIVNDRDDELQIVQENFQTILTKYSAQWNRAFLHANDKVRGFEQQLVQKSLESNSEQRNSRDKK